MTFFLSFFPWIFLNKYPLDLKAMTLCFAIFIPPQGCLSINHKKASTSEKNRPQYNHKWASSVFFRESPSLSLQAGNCMYICQTECLALSEKGRGQVWEPCVGLGLSLWWEWPIYQERWSGRICSAAYRVQVLGAAKCKGNTGGHRTEHLFTVVLCLYSSWVLNTSYMLVT